MPCESKRQNVYFSKFFHTALVMVHKIVTDHGVETAVLVSIEEWRDPQKLARRTLNSSLLKSMRWPDLPSKRGKLSSMQNFGTEVKENISIGKPPSHNCLIGCTLLRSPHGDFCCC